MVFYVYILQSCVNLSFYKGATNDLVRRVEEHNAGRVTSTHHLKPWNLVWFTAKPSWSEALHLERKLKNLSVKKLHEFIRKYPPPSLVGGPDVAPLRQSGC